MAEHPSYTRLRQLARELDVMTEDGLKDFEAVCWALDHILRYEQGMSIIQSAVHSAATDLPATAVLNGGGTTFNEDQKRNIDIAAQVKRDGRL